MSESLQSAEMAATDSSSARGTAINGAHQDLGGARQEVTLLRPVPLTVRVRLEDLSEAYRDWYKEQVSKDKRDELGRFLFGVSSASLGILVTLQRFIPQNPVRARYTSYLLVASALLLVLSAVCALYLAVPKNRQIRPEEIELVSLHRNNAQEMTRIAIIWFASWILGIAAAGVQLTL